MELRRPEKPYHTDHSIVYSCQYHVIFCPKYRRKVLVDALATRLPTLWTRSKFISTARAVTLEGVQS